MDQLSLILSPLRRHDAFVAAAPLKRLAA